jgi:threonylcarbamoyladenosine tRNA methylthiotransferase MtaB
MNNELKTFNITTLGCKVNQYESQQIRQLLENAGLAAAALSEKPNIVVVNTCCVTHIASAKSRRYINNARKLSPNAAIVVRGCLPTAQTGELNKIDDNIHLIGHNTDLSAELLRIITGQTTDAQNNVSKTATDPKIKHKNNIPPELAPLTSYAGHTRAFLKIQDGCDGYCTYCIVRTIRTNLYSKNPADVLQEARDLVAAGHKEIVLTGIFLGAFGRHTTRRKQWTPITPSPLADIADKLAKIDGLARLRLSSLEPADVTEELLDVFARHKNVIAPHLHLPLQSGSDDVLKRMCRQYRADEFLAGVALAQKYLDRPAITTDIIVGFPGETNSDFEKTIELAKQVGFAKMHIFPFSPRKGTPAFTMEGRIHPDIINTRVAKLAKLDTALAEKFKTQFIGEKATVIVEATHPFAKGRTERYFMLRLPSGRYHKNDLVTVEITPASLTANDTGE